MALILISCSQGNKNQDVEEVKESSVEDNDLSCSEKLEKVKSLKDREIFLFWIPEGIDQKTYDCFFWKIKEEGKIFHRYRPKSSFRDNQYWCYPIRVNKKEIYFELEEEFYGSELSSVSLTYDPVHQKHISDLSIEDAESIIELYISKYGQFFKKEKRLRNKEGLDQVSVIWATKKVKEDSNHESNIIISYDYYSNSLNNKGVVKMYIGYHSAHPI